MKYMISYDLKKPGQNYELLYDELKDVFKAKRVLESQWVFERNNTSAIKLREHFRKFIDTNDRLLVIAIGSSYWASWNIMVNDF